MNKNISGWKRTITLQIVLVCILHLATVAVAEPVRIQIDDVRSYFNSDPSFSECLELTGNVSRAIDLISLDHHDFDDDGQPEALVTASSCMTGTAGADIHSVFTMNADGSIREIKFNRNNPGIKITGIPLPLIGNRNWGMAVKGNLLCNRFVDGLGWERESPLVECYEFKNGEFLISSITYATTFKPSFDCQKAKTDREVVACRDEEVAKLDRELDREYRNLIESIPAIDQPALIASQNKWLKEVDSWAAYKWCCDEVMQKYSERIKVVREQQHTSIKVGVSQ